MFYNQYANTHQYGINIMYLYYNNLCFRFTFSSWVFLRDICWSLKISFHQLSVVLVLSIRSHIVHDGQCRHLNKIQFTFATYHALMDGLCLQKISRAPREPDIQLEALRDC